MSENNISTIAIGDPHFQINNIAEVDTFIERINTLIQYEKPTFIVCLGDILHTHERLHTTPLNRAYKFIDTLRKVAPTFVLVGNHDMFNNQQYLAEDGHWLGGMREWKDVTIVDKPIMEQFGAHFFTFIPYVPNGQFKNALDTLKEDWKVSSTIFAHQEFYGCKMGAIQSTEGDTWLSNLPFVISGHIHTRQRPQSNIYYVGSSMQQAFGENEESTVTHITFTRTRGEHILRDISLNMPRKRIIYKDIDDIDTFEPPNNVDKIKVTVSGTCEQFKSFKKTKKYKDMTESGVKIVFKPKKIIIEKSSDTNGVDCDTQEGEKDKSDTGNITTEANFNRILFDMVNEQRNPYLIQAFELVINDKEIDSSSILFI
jgi:DNA repair exonuclease SbcCD nuclease subunit